ncbi:thiamine biosynthesis protein ApbE [Caulobacter sp. Root487D2Y]|uniref:FAD:protein FMN transferase n=1 Tax=Caulobacter sp. Root487D2Y TaxID=1736547 RepID=UPI0006FB6653|nr:FAD:protein FMN transferase [Caulobacter sp. Root487D2Y]KQY28932.1 thiamine biosynthesis protein ApbE [Caulobacter sp. Root487D2Y]
MTRVLVPQLAEPPARPIGGAVLALAGQTMGTTWSVKLVAPPTANADALTAMAQRELDGVVREMSPWEPLSDLSRYNRAAAGRWTALPPAFAQVLRCALEVAEATDGAFDPTLGALVDLWGFGPRPFSGSPPPADAAARARDAAGWRRLTLDGDSLFQPGGLRLDLNGVAKGFAVDQVAAALDRAGARSYLIEVGGELRGTGAKPDGQPWWVELERPPTANDGLRTLVALHGLSVATSGDYRRFFEHDGRRYAHTLDPATAAPVANPTVSVTVLDESCMRADAYATALTVMAPDAALAFADAHGLAAMILARGPTGLEERLSPALSAMLDA